MNHIVRFATVALALFAYPAHAVDGVLEINHTCAVQTGCFPGDIAGYPVTISQLTPGSSFRLTSDLVIPDTNPGGIYLFPGLATDVAIDLNNFRIIRANCVVSFSIACMPAAASYENSGISIESGLERAISVKNGSVVGMAYHGLYLGPQSEVRNVMARWNSRIGIGNASDSTITGSSAVENGTGGIEGYNSVISGNVANDNGGDGITGYRSVMTGNTATGNAGDGIQGLGGSLVERNVAAGNTGFGLNLASDDSYRANAVTANTGGTVSVTGVNLGANACNGTATCP